MTTKIIVHKKCPKCGGEMTFSGNVLTSYPPWYGHQCETCGHTSRYDSTYPYKKIKYDTIAHEWED